MRALAWMLSERVCYSERSRVCTGVGIGDGGLAVQDIRHPFAEFLGDLGSRQHRQQVATAQGEDADLLLAAVGVQFDQRGHGVGEFV